jgi:hypothetical protein
MKTLMRVLTLTLSISTISVALAHTQAQASSGMGGMWGWDGGMSSFYGMPYYGSGSMTGEQDYTTDARQRNYMAIYMASALNWNGAQGLGYSYLPPMGIPALLNTYTYRSAISGN